MSFSGCNDGDLRLISISSPLAGRVEVCYDGVWGTVCSREWNNADAAVACRQLGYSSYGKLVKKNFILFEDMLYFILKEL